MSGPCYVGVIPGWLIHDEQGQLVAVIEQPPPMWPVLPRTVSVCGSPVAPDLGVNVTRAVQHRPRGIDGSRGDRLAGLP